MTSLIKIDVNDKYEQTVSARELHEKLDRIKDFQKFFIRVSELKVSFTRDNLKTLGNVVRLFIFRFDHVAITYLADSIDAERALPCKNVTIKQKTEKEYLNEIVLNFGVVFPDFNLIGTEVIVPGIGRIDMLCKHKHNNRDAIIELKMSGKNPNSQLIAYASAYENPILIGITEKPLSEQQAIDSIIYLTISDVYSGKIKFL